ncbi:MAG: prepilin-type N-terminal cleavage/methylation domain-containing protein [Eubacteriaceae bacterium]|jgi:prepilin-type N-terminal cleavage/methylation domain-containing protein
MNGKIDEVSFSNELEEYELLEETSESGFTFTELLISCAIMVVLAAVAVPVFSSVMDSVKNQADTATAASIQTAYETAVIMDPAFTLESSADCAALVTKLHNAGYLKESTYTPQKTGNNFVFDQSKGTVTVAEVP